MKIQKTSLDMFIPEDRRQALTRGESLPDRSYGAVIFADLSGYTKITEALSIQLGPQRGAEELTYRMEQIYTGLIAEIHNYRGSVIGISGDGITCWFDGDDGRRATSCAIAIQNNISQKVNISLPSDFPSTLGIKVAVIVGPVRRFLVGDPNIQLLEVIAGNELDRVALAEQLLNRGEIVVGVELLKKLGGLAQGVEWRLTPEEEYFAVITGLSQTTPPDPWPQIPQLDQDIARKWVFTSVYERIKEGEFSFLPELRQVVPLFLKFSGIDYDRDENAGQKLDIFIQRVQSILAHYEGYLCQLTIGDKGSNLLVAFGAPLSHEDNTQRALAAALKLKQDIEGLGFIKTIQIGMTQGRVWAGAHGGEMSRTYSVIGSEVNIAARLMSHAEPGQILVSPHVAEIASEFSFERLQPVKLKGIEKPMTPFLLLGRARSQTEPIQRNSLLGRDQERKILGEKLNSLVTLSDSPTGAVLVEGEAGVGKSRLVAELLEDAKQMGVQVLMGEGDPVERATQYYAYRRILESIFGITDFDEPASTQEKIKSWLADDPFLLDRAPLFNEILPLRWPDNELTSQMSGEARAISIREVLTRTMKKSLTQNGKPIPTMIVFDDAQWLDGATWTLMGTLQRDLPSVLLVLALRPILDGEVDAQIEEEYKRLTANPLTQRIQLDSLSHDATEQLVAERLGIRKLPPAVSEFVRLRTQGNPFFSEEIAYALRDAGIVRIQNGEAITDLAIDELNRIDFPDTVQGVITSRIDRLPPSHQLTLKVASAIGRAFIVTLLATVHPANVNKPTLVNYLSLLTQLGITDLETLYPELTYIFKHVITQEVVYGLMTFTQRKQLHCAIAEWYEKNYQEDLSPYYSRLAHHWLKGESMEKAIYYLDKAGEQALDLYSNQDVLRFITAAMELDLRMRGGVPLAGKPEPASNLRQARWERMLGTAHQRIGRLPDAQRHYNNTLSLLGRPMPETPSKALMQLLKELMKQVFRRLLPQTGTQRTIKDRAVKEELAQVDIENIFYYAQNLLMLSWGMLRRLNLAEEVGMPSLMAEGYSNLHLISGLAGLKRVSSLYHRLAWEAIEKSNRTSNKIFLHLREGVVLYANGRLDKAIEIFEMGIRLADELRDTRQMEELTASLASCLLLQGQFERSYQIWKDYHEKAIRKEGPQSQAWMLYGQGHNLIMLGKLNDAIHNLKASLEIPMAEASDRILNTTRNGALCLAYFRNGQFAEALDQIERLRQIAPATPAISNFINEYAPSFDAIFGLLENHRTGEHRLSEADLRRLEPSIQQIPNTAKALRKLPANIAGSWLYEGLAFWFSGKSEKAFAYWNKCLELAQRDNLPYELGRAHYEIGRHLDAGDSSRTGHLSQAIEIFTTLKTPCELELAKTALKKM